jgi:hypothetical protein
MMRSRSDQGCLPATLASHTICLDKSRYGGVAYILRTSGNKKQETINRVVAGAWPCLLQQSAEHLQVCPLSSKLDCSRKFKIQGSKLSQKSYTEPLAIAIEQQVIKVCSATANSATNSDTTTVVKDEPLRYSTLAGSSHLQMLRTSVIQIFVFADPLMSN